MNIYIKYMVSNRCKIAVKEVFIKMGFHFRIIGLGEVDVMEDITSEQQAQLREELCNNGFELIDDAKAILIEQIKNIIIETIHEDNFSIKIKFSHYLSEKLNQEYAYLANLFSEVQGTTIKQYLIGHKVEKVKELLTYGELSVTAISEKLNYSSVAHLSTQFKKVVGISPSQFLKLKNIKRKSMEEIEKSQSRPLINTFSKTIDKHKIKVFLVDDDPIFLKFLEIQFLETGNFIIETFKTAELCIENLVHNPDIIILDYHLNSIVSNAMTGLETLDIVKSLNSEIPIIILSSQDQIDIAVTCLHHKAVDYVVKNETAFLCLQKIIMSSLNYKKTAQQLHWFKTKM